MLCPRFFREKDSLENTLKKMHSGQIDRSNATAYKFTWGHTYYHELMHCDPVVSPKETWDFAYGACDVAKLAAKVGCKPGPFNGTNDASSILNGERFRLLVQAIPSQQRTSRWQHQRR